MLVLFALAAYAADAADDAPKVPAAGAPKLTVHGDVKTLFVAEQPKAFFGLSDGSAAALDALGLTEEDALRSYGLAADPLAVALADGRLKVTGTWRKLRLDVHDELALSTAPPATAQFGLGTGVAQTAPELVPLTWTYAGGGGDVVLRHRIDRLVLSAKLKGVDLAIGRQPVTFGVGKIFTPLDLVNPFTPATIDTEYKPGVDALRVDVYQGTATHLTGVAAWAGAPLWGDHARDPERPVLDDVVAAATGQSTVGVTDVLAFAGAVRGEPVLGVGTVSSIGPVGVHGEGTVTFPDTDEEPFVRLVLGADGRPTEHTTVVGEAYVQTFGAADPADYLSVATSPRFLRGEVWQMGQIYAAAAVSQEISPLVSANVSVIANLRDPSALIALGGAWSVSDDVDVVFGGYVGLGQAPSTVDLDLAVDGTTGLPSLTPPGADDVAEAVKSEFGLYPTAGYLQIRTYF